MTAATHMLDQIFSAHDALARVERPTWEYGFDWKLPDGVVLYPRNTITDYLSGLFRVLWPDVPVTVLSADSGPDAWEACARERPRALVVLCTMQSYIDHDLGREYAALVAHAPQPLAGRVITARQFGDFLPAGTQETKFYDYFRKTLFPAEGANRKKIYRAWNLFTDPLSQVTFAQILKRYLLRADTLIPTVDTHMYFEDMFTRGDDEVIVDCGGFTGDTLQYYLDKVGGSFAAYHVFEPDPLNFQKLVDYVGSLPPRTAARVRPERKAVAHTPGKLDFDGRGALESRVHTRGSISVESVPLDMALEGVDPTLIKMDLECYETFALLGARNTIRRARPVLSICVYHYLFDLWELPLLINSFTGGYRFFLRAYAEMFDYVCYAVPEERLSARGRALAGA
ncbi:FkbM family methyltransferase [Desulfovibrio sp.]|uniref:FkbM family methyltransferase n=1 Tax=Desulfovibrio sp. TaxID=885 RepID=UPI0023C4BB7C|nr:FkbM family methyltransferase [Desulfovibrio sp.]MDE7242045.1 FkbM family methyltransferase [Desulfovibrio sp.]